jgi:NAD(P)-dependent dehydrogenase (short-subunit alcohol dehydrogenase family)
MINDPEKRLIEALKNVDAHGDVAPPHVHDPMTMVLRGNAIQAVYRASKAALNTMMRSVGRASGGASDQQAHAHCPSNTVVWVNTRSRIHHRLLAATALACRCRWIGAVFLSNWRPSGISVELYFGTAGSMFAPKTV